MYVDESPQVYENFTTVELVVAFLVLRYYHFKNTYLVRSNLPRQIWVQLNNFLFPNHNVAANSSIAAPSCPLRGRGWLPPPSLATWDRSLGVWGLPGVVVSARPSLSGLRKSHHGPRASLSPGAEAVSRDCLSRVVVQGAPGCSSPGPSAVPRGGRAPHQLATPSPLSCNGTYNQNGFREVETQSANTLVSFGFCDVKLSEKREDSFVSESITCGLARVRDQQEELRWDAADVIMDSPDGNVLLPLVSGGVSRPKRDPGTRPNWGFSGRTPSPHLSPPPPPVKFRWKGLEINQLTSLKLQ